MRSKIYIDNFYNKSNSKISRKYQQYILVDFFNKNFKEKYLREDDIVYSYYFFESKNI